MDKIVVGNIAKPQGIRGEVKITPLTDDATRFKNLKHVYVGNILYKINAVKVLQNGVFLMLEGIDDRDKAELLRGKDVSIERSDAVELPQDRYFIVDIVGSTVLVDGKAVGKVKDILQNGCADVYVVEDENKKVCMFPAIKRILKEVNVEEKKIVVDKEAFDDLVVYED
ncbi:MAG: ribosome maturation factor RimM [Clostridia bacterium]